jgi:hypothetical protein
MRLLFIACLIYVVLGIYLYVFQRGFIYFPVPAIESDLDQLSVISEGRRIRITVLNPGHARAMLYFGGNAEQIDYSALALQPHFEDLTIYLT